MYPHCKDNMLVSAMTPGTSARASDAVELSFCLVNTSKPELLARGLDAISRERAALPFRSEVLVLDNGSRDGSQEVARRHPAVDQLIALPERRGKAFCDSELLRRARGRYALLLNEDSELTAGAARILHEQLAARADAACAGARLVRPDGTGQACAWRFPTPLTALAGAVGLHRLLAVQSRVSHTREVDWCQSSALLVRRSAAAEVGYLDEDFFVYSDEVDFAKRLREAGWRSLYVPQATAIHAEQLSTSAAAQPRIVELSRNRDLYMRKHHSVAAARAVRWLTAWTYAVRAAVALVLQGRSARRYWMHVIATLHPERGSGLRELADAYNRQHRSSDIPQGVLGEDLDVAAVGTEAGDPPTEVAEHDARLRALVGGEETAGEQRRRDQQQPQRPQQQPRDPVRGEQ
jgi:N-acetylglucosaminyl-diphospho-decaprenol L-rhamnosyltransferase